MAVIDMVMKGLEHCKNHDGTTCPECPYFHDDCVAKLCADALELLKSQKAEFERLTLSGEWKTVEMPKGKGDYLVTAYDDSASENIVLHCRWDDLPVGTENRFWLKGEDITDYVIAWMKFPNAYDKTHNPILSDADDAWVSQHM